MPPLFAITFNRGHGQWPWNRPYHSLSKLLEVHTSALHKQKKTKKNHTRKNLSGYRLEHCINGRDLQDRWYTQVKQSIWTLIIKCRVTLISLVISLETWRWSLGNFAWSKSEMALLCTIKRCPTIMYTLKQVEDKLTHTHNLLTVVKRPSLCLWKNCSW